MGEIWPFERLAPCRGLNQKNSCREEIIEGGCGLDEQYIAKVKQYKRERIWATPDFQQP